MYKAHLLITHGLVTVRWTSYLSEMSAACLQWFDAVGSAAGRVFGL